MFCFSLHIYLAGKAVAKFCAKYLHQQMLSNEAYSSGDIGTSVQKAFMRLVYIVLHLLNSAFLVNFSAEAYVLFWTLF